MKITPGQTWQDGEGPTGGPPVGVNTNQTGHSASFLLYIFSFRVISLLKANKKFLFESSGFNTDTKLNVHRHSLAFTCRSIKNKKTEFKMNSTCEIKFII
ncbi:hypothetical protein XENORESO_011670 [Xenotaenia resolanae]|uniref:Uncharacterized protein n=1 Tax=Xenotaenia resolanae TaxID=208358 RepID=A0ABV0VWA8_9TELE